MQVVDQVGQRMHIQQMAPRTRMIEVDEATAMSLESRASALGLSVQQLIAELAQDHEKNDDLAELDRRWNSVWARGSVPHEKVVRWLHTWGTSKFRPWREQ